MAWTEPRLVGRTEEIERLRAGVARGRSGQRATVLVDGEAGVGKTRLVAEAIARFREPGDVLIVGHGVELSGGELPYGMASECLRSVVGGAGVEDVRAAAGESAGALAALCPPLSSGASAVEPARVEQAQLFYGFVTTVETLASERLVWLVLEDLQWADASSRDLLGYLVKVAAPCRLLTLVTVRTHDPAMGPAAADIVADLVRADGVERMSLGALSRGEVADQIADLTQAPASTALVDRVVELSHGVPFLTEQLIAAGLTETGTVPATVLEPMQARIRRLDPDTQRLVQIASLADGHLTHDLLERAYQLEVQADDGRFAAAVAAAINSHVLVFDPIAHTYTFVHALLREAVDTTVSPMDRRRWHRTLATLCAPPRGQGPDPRVQIAAAHHWALAGADAAAFEAALDAADQCHRLGATGEQATLLCRALDLWDRVPDPAAHAGRTRDSVVCGALRALEETTDVEGAIALLDTELGRSDGARDPMRYLCLRLYRDGLARDLGRDPEPGLYGDALDDLEALMRAEPSPVIVSGILVLGWHLSDAEPELSLRLQSHAADLADELGDRELRRWATMAKSAQAAYQGRFDETVEMCKPLLDQSRDSVLEFSDLENYCGLWRLLGGRYEDAKALFERVLARLGDPRLAPALWAFATLFLGQTLVALGKWDAAQRVSDRLNELPQAPGRQSVWSAELAGGLACNRGDLDTADHWLETQRAHLPPNEDGTWLPMRTSHRSLEAKIAVAHGDLLAAREHLASIWPAAGAHRVPDIWSELLLAAHVEAELAEATSDPTDQKTETALAAIRAFANQVPKACRLADASSAHLDAELARATRCEDPTAWSAVVEAWRQIGHIPHLACSLTRLAAAQLAVSDRDAASAPLTEAFRIATELGAEPLRHRIIDLAQRGRLTLDDGPSTRGSIETGRIASRLTDREHEVLRLVAQGMSNNEIAQKLFISPKTASVHVSRILTKLGVNSRAKATAIAYEERLLTDVN